MALDLVIKNGWLTLKMFFCIIVKIHKNNL